MKKMESLKDKTKIYSTLKLIAFVFFVAILWGCGGSVMVDSRPQGARLSLNDRYVGTTPANVSLSWGKCVCPYGCTLRAELSGYLPKSTKIGCGMYYSVVGGGILSFDLISLEEIEAGKAKGAGQQQIMQQQMQGPTIIITTPNQPVEVKEVPAK
ncbi:PEGA domain-containing protein [Nitrospinae bacterium AH_259_B05_G02_I21]|nr:PEGA domain-containing protein [Nitrospinae bacterium AH_259_B05_G02_I21]MDA2931995.1 PEGA domain-containing protein [Nitrospinae bacterium AH-259-F20]